MAKFNAATALDPVEFDFSKYNGPVGEIPEPSQGQVEEFFDRIGNLRKFASKIERDVKEAAEEGEEALDEYIENLPQAELNKFKEEISLWISELCSGFPSRADVDALPYRVFSAFLVFLLQEYGPKDVNGPTTASGRPSATRST